MNIQKYLEDQQREKLASYARSVDGQTEAVKKYRLWALREHQDCIDSVQTVERWINEKGQRRSSVSSSINPISDAPDAVVESNFRSRRARLQKLTEFITVIEATLDQLRQRRPLHENFIEELDGLKAALPNENVMEIVRGPKPSK